MLVLSIALVVIAAILLDWYFAEPKRFHPLVGFGHWANQIEKHLNNKKKITASYWSLRLIGCIALFIAVIPIVGAVHLMTDYLAESSFLLFIWSGVLLYAAIGWQSLRQHAMAIYRPLKVGDLDKARYALSMIVSRDCGELNSTEIATAATESVLENGADAIFSAIFWFCLLGPAGVVLYRLSNTLDAMWGYKTERFRHFGWAAARFDDVLNFIPARLTALSYACCGQWQSAWSSWQQQAGQWKSPNAGPVMASGAGALGVSLGGAAVYQGQRQQRPTLGCPLSPSTIARAWHIDRACRLVNRVLVLWLFFITTICLGLDIF